MVSLNEGLEVDGYTHWLDTDMGGYVTLCGIQGHDSNIVNEYTRATCPECQSRDRRS